MTVYSQHASEQDTQALALGSYRHDLAYTAALKSLQALALGSYRNDVAYAAALKSIQTLALGNYRNDLSYTAALKSIPGNNHHKKFTDVEHGLASVIFFGAFFEERAVS